MFMVFTSVSAFILYHHDYGIKRLMDVLLSFFDYPRTAGNVKLRPELLEKHQAYVKEQLKSDNDRPVFLVFHGGSGSTKSEITTAVKAGVVKMNVGCYSLLIKVSSLLFRNANRMYVLRLTGRH